MEYLIYNVSQDTVWVELKPVEKSNIDFNIVIEKPGEKIGIVLEIHRGWPGYDDIEGWKQYCSMISPGDTLHGFYNLITYYGVRSGKCHLESMIYRSLLIFELLEAKDGKKRTPDYPPFWKGKLESSIDFVINVKEPQKEEKEALIMFLKARKAKGHRSSLDLFSKFMQLYPHSVYSPKAQYYVIRYTGKLATAQKTSQQEIQKEIEKLINLYPDSPYALGYKDDKIFLQR